MKVSYSGYLDAYRITSSVMYQSGVEVGGLANQTRDESLAIEYKLILAALNNICSERKLGLILSHMFMYEKMFVRLL